MNQVYIVTKSTGGILGVFSSLKMMEDAIAVTVKESADAPAKTLAEHLGCGFGYEIWPVDDYSKLHTGGAALLSAGVAKIPEPTGEEEQD